MWRIHLGREAHVKLFNSPKNHTYRTVCYGTKQHRYRYPQYVPVRSFDDPLFSFETEPAATEASFPAEVVQTTKNSTSS